MIIKIITNYKNRLNTLQSYEKTITSIAYWLFDGLWIY